MATVPCICHTNLYDYVKEAIDKVQIAGSHPDATIAHMGADIALTEFIMTLSRLTDDSFLQEELIRLINSYNQVGKNYE